MEARYETTEGTMKVPSLMKSESQDKKRESQLVSKLLFLHRTAKYVAASLGGTFVAAARYCRQQREAAIDLVLHICYKQATKKRREYVELMLRSLCASRTNKANQRGPGKQEMLFNSRTAT